MKKKRIGLLFAVAGLCSIGSVAQSGNFLVKKINGVTFYQYKVQASEGLYSISKKFNVSVSEIEQLNPEVKDGLKAGQDILVPVKIKNQASQLSGVSHTNTKSAAPVSNVPTTPAPQKNYVYHTVTKDQTLFSISKRYHVDIEEITKINPFCQKGIKEGMVLRIPTNSSKERIAGTMKLLADTVKQVSNHADTRNAIKNTANHESANTKKKCISYVVKPSETLYSIAKRNNVSVSEIVEINPGTDKSLNAGSVIKIPVTSTSAAQASNISSNVVENVIDRPRSANVTENKAKEPAAETTDLSNGLISSNAFAEINKRTMKIAFLLPFMTEQTTKDANYEKFTEFYQGALLAVYEAKKRGVSFEIYSYDTDKTEDRLNEVLQNPELKSMDLIIGPAFSNQIALINDYSKDYRVNTLIPFSPKVTGIDSNPFLYQFNPGSEKVSEYASALLSGKFKNTNIVFAELPDVNTEDEGYIMSVNLKNELLKSGVRYSTVDLNSPETADFHQSLRTDKKNLVLFNTDKYALVYPYLNAARKAAKQYKVSFFEQYAWRSQAEQLPNPVSFSPFAPEMNADKLATFNQLYTQFYGRINTKQSPRFDLLGYDLTLYFVEILNMGSKRISDKVSTFVFMDGIQSKPRFDNSNNNSGFINQKIYLTEN